jgi:hypothetical protein
MFLMFSPSCLFSSFFFFILATQQQVSSIPDRNQPFPFKSMTTYNNNSKNNNNHQDSSAMDNLKITSTTDGISRRSQRQSSSSFVIMRTKSKYHPAMYLILVVPLIAILVPIYISLTQGDYNTAWGLIWSLTFVGFGYMMVLPTTLYVRSDGAVGVKTSLMTYKFTDIVRAYEAGFSTDDLLRPRIKFATDFKRPNRVAVRRRNGKWDLLVSPVDAEEFIAAVNSTAADQDQKEDALADETGSRQDLSKQ